ncbi:MAG: phytoene desaturase family protein, partial [Nitrospinota bacterium]
MKDFDVVVIGTGIGGLICAGTLAAQGVKVLAIEKNPNPGGYLTSFRRRKFVFDSAVDCFSGLDENGVIRHTLRALDIEDEISFVRVDPIQESFFPGIRVAVDGNLEIYIERLKNLFPAETKGIDRFWEAMRAIYKDIEAWAETLIRENGILHIPSALLKYANHTYLDLLNENITNKKLQALLSDRCPFLGLAPSKVSAVSMCALMMSYFISGAYRATGGCQKLADILVKGIRKKRGKVLLKKKVSSIILEKGRAIAVRTSDGSEYTAKKVVSNIDFLQTFTKLLNGNDAHSIQKRLTHPGHSSSFFVLYLGTDMDLRHLHPSSSIGYFPTFDVESLFKDDHAFENASSLGVTVPTILDKTMAPDGSHVLSAHEMISYSYTASWKDHKQALSLKLLKKVEKILPGIQKHVIHLEAATPSTLERYTSNFMGSSYGWQQVPRQKVSASQ